MYDDIFQKDCEVQVTYKLLNYLSTVSSCGTWSIPMDMANNTVRGGHPISLLALHTV